MNDIVFISAQPHDPYFVWQIEVQIVNFRHFGISDKMQILVWYPDTDVQKAKGQQQEPFHKEMWDNLATKYPEVKFFFYKDSILDIGIYIPVLRPRTLAKHFEKFPELKEKTIFYHDSDIIFNYLPNFEELSKDSINWESDTSSYLDYNYLRSKENQGGIPENESVKILCDIGGITVDMMKNYVGKTGGAQYILKNIDASFWKDVERMCIDIRTKFWYSIEGSVNRKYFANENTGFQSWCADMWAVNMALWKRGYTTNITEELDFSWATDSIETAKKKPIYHNAGATGAQADIFYKGRWITISPIGKQHPVNKNSASSFYVQAINDVK